MQTPSTPTSRTASPTRSSACSPSGTADRRDGAAPATVAGKTGTTDASIDTWFVGYTQQRATAVWVGDDPTVTNGRQAQEPQRPHGSAVTSTAPSSAPRSPRRSGPRSCRTAIKGTDTGRLGQPAVDRCSAAAGTAVPRRHGQVRSAEAFGILAGAGFSARLGSPVDSGAPTGTVGSTTPGAGATASDGDDRDDPPEQRQRRRHEADGQPDEDEAEARPATAVEDAPGRSSPAPVLGRPADDADGRGRSAVSGDDGPCQTASCRRTSAATRPPSARPFVRGCTAFITRPIAAGPSAPAARTSATASATMPPAPRRTAARAGSPRAPPARRSPASASSGRPAAL